jgi:hypothetical protein
MYQKSSKRESPQNGIVRNDPAINEQNNIKRKTRINLEKKID